ncbi:MAG: nuclear transport factor 2 family protein [Pseudomonadota bacterium]|nr:nuclear transport factor 2 family protein [Pseudomonadota bacterium]
MPQTQYTTRDVLAANAAFYAAFRSGDLQAMESLWSRSRDVCIYHPSQRGIEGREAVMRSWRDILLDGAPPMIYPVDPIAILGGSVALVVCEEDIEGRRLIATNVFVREDGGWRLTQHHATGLALDAKGSAQDRPSR